MRKGLNRPAFSRRLLLCAAAFSLFPLAGKTQQIYKGPAIAQMCFHATNPDERIRYCTQAINSDILDLDGVAMQGMAGGLRVMRQDVFSADILALAYYNRATAYFSKGDMDPVIEDLNQVIRMRPEYADAFANRGNAYAAKREYDKAIRDYTQAINLSPFFAAAFTNRGTAYDLLGKHDLAFRDYNRAIRLDPKSAVAYNNRGSSYRDTHDYGRALKDFDKAIQIDPRYVEAYDNRAATYQLEGDSQRAIEDYRHILQIDPSNAAVRVALDKLQAK